MVLRAPLGGANNFSVKWSGQLKVLVSGTYTFTVTADDWARPYAYITPLTAGALYSLELQFYELGAVTSVGCNGAIPDRQRKPSQRSS